MKRRWKRSHSYAPLRLSSSSFNGGMGHEVRSCLRFVDSNCHNYKLICPGQLRVCRVAKSTDLSDIYARQGEASEPAKLAFNGPSDKRRLSDKCVAWTLR